MKIIDTGYTLPGPGDQVEKLGDRWRRGELMTVLTREGMTITARFNSDGAVVELPLACVRRPRPEMPL